MWSRILGLDSSGYNFARAIEQTNMTNAARDVQGASFHAEPP